MKGSPVDSTLPPAEAAVLVPVFRDSEGELQLLLVRRTEGGIHGGQIAFPGGRREAGDATLEDTAVREAEEEVGLPRSSVRVLAVLPEVFVRASGFRITPILAIIVPPAAWLLAEREIAEVLAVRVAELARPEPRRVPFFRVGGHVLWGATYRIVHPLLPRLLAREWEV